MIPIIDSFYIIVEYLPFEDKARLFYSLDEVKSVIIDTLKYPPIKMYNERDLFSHMLYKLVFPLDYERNLHNNIRSAFSMDVLKFLTYDTLKLGYITSTHARCTRRSLAMMLGAGNCYCNIKATDLEFIYNEGCCNHNLLGVLQTLLHLCRYEDIPEIFNDYAKKGYFPLFNLGYVAYDDVFTEENFYSTDFDNEFEEKFIQKQLRYNDIDTILNSCYCDCDLHVKVLNKPCCHSKCPTIYDVNETLQYFERYGTCVVTDELVASVSKDEYRKMCRAVLGKLNLRTEYNIFEYILRYTQIETVDEKFFEDMLLYGDLRCLELYLRKVSIRINFNDTTFVTRVAQKSPYALRLIEKYFDKINFVDCEYYFTGLIYCLSNTKGISPMAYETLAKLIDMDGYKASITDIMKCIENCIDINFIVELSNELPKYELIDALIRILHDMFYKQNFDSKLCIKDFDKLPDMPYIENILKIFMKDAIKPVDDTITSYVCQLNNTNVLNIVGPILSPISGLNRKVSDEMKQLLIDFNLFGTEDEDSDEDEYMYEYQEKNRYENNLFIKYQNEDYEKTKERVLRSDKNVIHASTVMYYAKKSYLDMVDIFLTNYEINYDISKDNLDSYISYLRKFDE
ncbi:hypothetical protein D3C87_862740 [compost metagenome]